MNESGLLYLDLVQFLFLAIKVSKVLELFKQSLEISWLLSLVGIFILSKMILGRNLGLLFVVEVQVLL